jgi:methionyl-tRNA formyltransferase
LRRAVPLLPDDTTASVTPRLAELGAELLVETLARLQAGDLTPEPQPAEGATLAPSFRKQDGALDWLASAVDIDRRVRALQPWPGTFAFRGGRRLAIWRVRPVAGDTNAAPGTILAVHDAGFRVACGAGAVEVLELQRAGGTRQTAAEFLRGHLLVEGERLHPDPDLDS